LWSIIFFQQPENMEAITGREAEKEILARMLVSKEAELIDTAAFQVWPARINKLQIQAVIRPDE